MHRTRQGTWPLHCYSLHVSSVVCVMAWMASRMVHVFILCGSVCNDYSISTNSNDRWNMPTTSSQGNQYTMTAEGKSSHGT
jgi:hypothetical protein